MLPFSLFFTREATKNVREMTSVNVVMLKYSVATLTNVIRHFNELLFRRSKSIYF